MSIKSDLERRNTRNKLGRLAERLKALSFESGGDEELREMTTESLKHTINQLQEEIAIFDAHRGVASETGMAHEAGT
jgi:hypothetical protein